MLKSTIRRKQEESSEFINVSAEVTLLKGKKKKKRQNLLKAVLSKTPDALSTAWKYCPKTVCPSCPLRALTLDLAYSYSGEEQEESLEWWN